MPDQPDSILRHFPTMLRRWDGSIGRMWELTISHRTLRLRFEQHGRIGNLMIACIDPRLIHGPTEWVNSHIEIVREADGFLVIDAQAGIEVHAGHIEITENRRPLNAFTIVTTSGRAG